MGDPVAVTGLSDANGSKHAGVAQLTQYDGVVELERSLVRVRLDATHEERLRLTQSLHQLLQRKLFKTKLSVKSSTKRGIILKKDLETDVELSADTGRSVFALARARRCSRSAARS